MNYPSRIIICPLLFIPAHSTITSSPCSIFSLYAQGWWIQDSFDVMWTVEIFVGRLYFFFFLDESRFISPYLPFSVAPERVARYICANSYVDGPLIFSLQA